MAGDYYATVTDVQQLFMNSGLGSTGNTMYDDNAVEVALRTSFYKIHLYIDPTGSTTTKLTNTVYTNVLAGIQLDLIMMRILQSKHLHQNALSDAGAIQGFFRVMPAFTREHISWLELIKKGLRTETARIYNETNGQLVTGI